jgi:phosphoribosylanthranilate isomerase
VPDGLRFGFAGGIGPDNVKRVIREISAKVDAPFWIDMESGVRTDDRFDLNKVRRVLETAAPFVEADNA